MSPDDEADIDEGALFDEDMAASYDERTARMGGIKDALHAMLPLILAELPEDASILCVGCGTGAELLYLAERFPRWTFTAVEPASAMLDLCRSKAEAAGIADRCTFHEGYLDTLEGAHRCHAATSILVSQFLLDDAERVEFFREIASRLLPGGALISVDLSSPFSKADYERVMDVWMRLLTVTGMKVDREVYGRDVAMTPPERIESMLSDAGLVDALPFFQALFIRGWFAHLK